jgi:hypothetical protein
MMSSAVGMRMILLSAELAAHADNSARLFTISVLSHVASAVKTAWHRVCLAIWHKVKTKGDYGEFLVSLFLLLQGLPTRIRY